MTRRVSFPFVSFPFDFVDFVDFVDFDFVDFVDLECLMCFVCRLLISSLLFPSDDH